MSSTALAWAWAQQEVPSGEKFVLVALADLADHENAVTILTDVLAERTRFGRRTVQRYAEHLEHAGFLVREQRKDVRGRQLPSRLYLAVGGRIAAPLDLDTAWTAPAEPVGPAAPVPKLDLEAVGS